LLSVDDDVNMGTAHLHAVVQFRDIIAGVLITTVVLYNVITVLLRKRKICLSGQSLTR
jgi:hypothetical protein